MCKNKQCSRPMKSPACLHCLAVAVYGMHGPSLPVSLTAWRWISTLYPFAWQFLSRCRVSVQWITAIKTWCWGRPSRNAAVSVKHARQVYRPPGKIRKRMSRRQGGTVQRRRAYVPEMKPFPALQGETMLQWTRSTEQTLQQKYETIFSLFWVHPSSPSACQRWIKSTKSGREECDFHVAASHPCTYVRGVAAENVHRPPAVRESLDGIVMLH